MILYINIQLLDINIVELKKGISFDNLAPISEEPVQSIRRRLRYGSRVVKRD